MKRNVFYPVLSMQRLSSLSWILCWQRLPPRLDVKFHMRGVRWLKSKFKKQEEKERKEI